MFAAFVLAPDSRGITTEELEVSSHDRGSAIAKLRAPSVVIT